MLQSLNNNNNNKNNVMKSQKTNNILKQNFCSIFAVYLKRKDRQLISESWCCFGISVRYQITGKSHDELGTDLLDTAWQPVPFKHAQSLTLDQAAL